MTDTTSTHATVDSTGMAPEPAPTTDSLTDAYNANTTITACCYALLNASVTWNTSTQGSQPYWFATLATAVATAQTHANMWLAGSTQGFDTLDMIFAALPQVIIDYTDTFTAATNDILMLLQAEPGNDTEVRQLLQTLLAQLQTGQSTLNSVQSLLQGFAADAQADYESLKTAQISALQSVALSQDIEASIGAQINLVMNEIQLDSKLAESSEISLAAGTFVVVAAAAFAVSSDGANKPLLVCAEGVVTSGAAVPDTLIFSDTVQSDLKKLYSMQGSLSDEQRQVSAASGLTTLAQSLIDANNSLLTAISDLLDMWTTLVAKMQAVLDELNGAQSDTAAIIEELDLQTAQTDWQQLAAYASAMQNNNVSVSATSQPGVDITTTVTTIAG